MKNKRINKDYLQTERYLNDLIHCLTTDFNDLEYWSVVNKDLHLETIIKIRTAFEKLKEKI